MKDGKRDSVIAIEKSGTLEHRNTMPAEFDVF